MKAAVKLIKELQADGKEVSVSSSGKRLRIFSKDARSL